MKKTLAKYSIMRIRHKISFMAFLKKMTVEEMILEQIIKTHDFLVKEGSIPLYDKNLPDKMLIFETILYDE